MSQTAMTLNFSHVRNDGQNFISLYMVWTQESYHKLVKYHLGESTPKRTVCDDIDYVMTVNVCSPSQDHSHPDDYTLPT